MARKVVKILKKSYQEDNVLIAAKARLKTLYTNYDKIIVNFSGGKDSTALLYLSIEVGRELNKLPIDVIYVDHEIEGLETVKLLEAINAMPEVNFKWIVYPFELRNAASFNAPKWYPWNPLEENLWCRKKPDCEFSDIEGLYFSANSDYVHPDGLPYKANAVIKAMDFQEICEIYAKNYERKGYTTISLVGLRAQESMVRYTIVCRKTDESYISGSKAYPLYDWSAVDVWKYIKETGLPYNKEYDLMNKTDLYNKLNTQRVGSIFAEESLRTLHQWPEFYKDYWHKILERAEGIKTAWRYNNDGIYTGTKIEKSEHILWSEYTKSILNSMSDKTRALSQSSINKIITWHKNRTDYPIAENESEACPLTGISWEFLARIAIRGDSKERNLQKVPGMARAAQEKINMSRDLAISIYGSEAYKEKYKNK